MAAAMLVPAASRSRAAHASPASVPARPPRLGAGLATATLGCPTGSAVLAFGAMGSWRRGSASLLLAVALLAVWTSLPAGVVHLAATGAQALHSSGHMGTCGCGQSLPARFQSKVDLTHLAGPHFVPSTHPRCCCAAAGK